MTPEGLYRFDVKDKKNFTFLDTVKDIRKEYSRQEYEQAKKARDIYAMVGYPSDKDYCKMIHHGLILNCDVTEQDVINAHEMFGPDIFALKGKTVCTQPDPVVTDYVAVPTLIQARHKELTLGVDLMFVQKQIFMVTVSKGIKFTMITHIEQRTALVIFAAIQEVCNIY